MRNDINCICGRKLGVVDSHENVKGVYLICKCKREIEVINDGKNEKLGIRVLSPEESKIKRKFSKCICKRKLARIDDTQNIRGVYLKCESCDREIEIVNNIENPEPRTQNPEVRGRENPEPRGQRSEVRGQLACI